MLLCVTYTHVLYQQQLPHSCYQTLAAGSSVKWRQQQLYKAVYTDNKISDEEITPFTVDSRCQHLLLVYTHRLTAHIQ